MIRRWLLVAMVIGLGWVLIANRGELGGLVHTLGSATWGWLLVAAALQAMSYLTFAEFYRVALSTLGIPRTRTETLKLLLASLSVNAVLPSAGIAGTALFADDAIRRGQSATRTAAGVLLATAVDFASITLMLGVSVLYWVLHRHIGAFEVQASLALALLATGVTGGLLFGLLRPRRLLEFLRIIESASSAIIRRIRPSAPVRDGWADRIVDDLDAAGAGFRDTPHRFGRLLSIALAFHAIDVANLGAVFAAYHQKLSGLALLAGYPLALVAWFLSPVPQGIGVVEATIALVYSSIGVPHEVAVAAALAYRGLVFWLPLLIGFALLRGLRSFRVDR